ncbi:RNA polymerase sigma factor [Marinicauda sp. Alg238-R41]|uniref:RNA polymerase sigma factor n=1 Tax=Marinicauda sp. Alg238-R41 TaxID=2993447 RepID=UPI0022E5C16A|nr:RNA polymerase sigma factor [Marinicauda sp. Alg238-R41]
MPRSRDAERSLDAYLLAEVRLGDRGALDQLVRRWTPRMTTHAWRLLGDREQARDVVQESWTQALRGLNRLRQDRAFSVWILRIVTRRCAYQIRGLQRERALASDVRNEPDPPNPAVRVELAPDQQRVRAAIKRLPADQAAAIALFYLQDLSIAEIAVALDVPAGTVKTRLMHARTKLRAFLEGEIDE